MNRYWIYRWLDSGFIDGWIAIYRWIDSGFIDIYVNISYNVNFQHKINVSIHFFVQASPLPPSCVIIIRSFLLPLLFLKIINHKEVSQRQRYFHQGQKHTISNFIRGICPPDLIHQGHIKLSRYCAI